LAFFSHYGFVISACFQNRFVVPAPEARKPVAHGETVGLAVKKIKPRSGRKKTGVKTFLSPHSGA
jgi:hypothetical protein